MIDLMLVPNVDCITRTVVIDIVARSTEPIRLTAADIAFAWNPRRLTLLGTETDRATVPNLLAGCFGPPWDFYGANETLPPADGNGYAMWLCPLNGIPVYGSDEVLLSLVFSYDGSTPTQVEILDVLDEGYPLVTSFWAGEIVGANVLDEVHGCKVRHCLEVVDVEH